MTKILLLILSLFICHAGMSQVANVLPAPLSTAQTSVADADSWNAFHNPAMLAYIGRVELAAAFENRYFIKELSTKSIQAGMSTRYVNVGVSFSHFGYSLYHEMLAGIDVARNFSDKFAIGIGFDYYTAYFSAIGEYHGALLGRIGLSLRVVDGLVVGFSTFNPFQNNIQTELAVKRLPSVYSLGTAYHFTPQLVWRTQIDKEISSRYRFATGAEYLMLQCIKIKLGGYVLKYFIPCLGFAARLKDYSADLDCEINPILGVTTKITLQYHLK